MRPPSSTDQIDATTARVLDRLVRDHRWEGDWSRVNARADRSRRRRRRMPLAISAVAAAVLVALVMVLSVRTDPHAAGNHRWSDPVNGISIDVEAPFQRASLALAPASHEILSLSTGPLLIGSPTDRLPTRAAEVIGDHGILITIDELERPEDLAPTGGATPAIGFQERPDSFDLNKYPEAGSTLPETRSLTPGGAGMRRWAIPFTDHGRRLTAIVVAGADVTEAQLDHASRMLDTLQVDPLPIVDQNASFLFRSIGAGRVRYVGMADGHAAYVGVANDGTVCTLLVANGLSCTTRAIFDEAGGAKALNRSDAGEWFGVIVPPGVGTVTANGTPIGEGPQPVLMDGITGDTLVIRQGDRTLMDTRLGGG